MLSFDYVIVGGGTAGCVLANRLSENPSRRVLLLEAGGEDKGRWLNIPAGFAKLLVDPTFNWRFQSEPEPNCDNRTIVCPRGKGLGGSSLINGMIIVRGQPRDFDGWAQLGNRGWGYDDVLPYFRRMESFEDGDTEERGGTGPLSVVRVRERPVLAEAFLSAAAAAGFPHNSDYNGRDQEGFGYYQVNQKQGRRWSAAQAYLRPVRKRANLAVETGAFVTKLNLNGKRVTGITFQRDGVEHEVTAGEVLLAAGAVQSPQLLEISGIGDPKILSTIGVPVLHALPGVGANYIDHFCTRMNWRVNQPITLNEQSRGLGLARAVAEFYLAGQGILTLGTGLVHGFVKTRPELESPDVQYFFMHASYGSAATRQLDHKPGMTIGVAQLRPQSKGTIHAQSSDPSIAPSIRPNLLSAPDDITVMVEGMKVARRIMSQPAIAKYIDHEMKPGAAVETDAAWEKFLRQNGQTIYHPVGTCAMGQGPQAVVGANLKVHGLDGLRIIDASVMPTQVSGNTMAAVLMVAEKGADLVRSGA